MPQRLPNSTSNQDPLIIGHRGASALAPENTLAAFARAIHDGADGVEFDVRSAQDGVPVVIHDKSLRRTGLSQHLIAETNSNLLSHTDVGSWFNRANPRLAREEYSLEAVPTLEQVFSFFTNRAARAVERALIYLEMKYDRPANISSDLAQAIVQLVKDYNLQSRVVVVSFNLTAITQVKQIEPSLRTGALFAPKSGTRAVIRKPHMLAAAVDCGADEILLHRVIASRRVIEMAAETNLKSVVWTVDDSKWILRARRWGIYALITNNPAVLRQRESAVI